MSDDCELRKANGDAAAECDGDECPFWRIVEHVGDAPGSGCAVSHFRLLGDEHVAAWLLSVRDRLELLGCRDYTASDD